MKNPETEAISGFYRNLLLHSAENQPPEPVKTKTSPFRSLDRTYNLIEGAFTREKSKERKTYFYKPVV